MKVFIKCEVASFFQVLLVPKCLVSLLRQEKIFIGFLISSLIPKICSCVRVAGDNLRILLLYYVCGGVCGVRCLLCMWCLWCLYVWSVWCGVCGVVYVCVEIYVAWCGVCKWHVCECV